MSVDGAPAAHVFHMRPGAVRGPAASSPPYLRTPASFSAENPGWESCKDGRKENNRVSYADTKSSPLFRSLLAQLLRKTNKQWREGAS